MWEILKIIPLKVWAIVVVALIIFGTIFYLYQRSAILERQLQTTERDKKNAEDKAEGLKILVNSANTAQEVENERKITNQKSANSNVSNQRYSNSRGVDSNQRSNSFANAKREFCNEYPNDSLCN